MVTYQLSGKLKRGQKEVPIVGFIKSKGANIISGLVVDGFPPDFEDGEDHHSIYPEAEITNGRLILDDNRSIVLLEITLKYITVFYGKDAALKVCLEKDKKNPHQFKGSSLANGNKITMKINVEKIL